jgi:guanine deaminase
MSTVAIRGSALTFKDNPFAKPTNECITYEEDAILVFEGGLITKMGPASEVLKSLPKDISIKHYTDSLILPGFIDCHVHYPQTEIIGAYGKQLIDWLNKYTFVAEQNFRDKSHASEVAKVFLRECLRAGTTTATTFCTVHPDSVDAFFEESEKLNMRNIAGKVLMDRNAPEALTDTAQSGYDQTKALIARWHGKGRQLYCVTPRFAPTSTPEQMEMTGAVWNEHPGTYLQSHVSENKAEIEWVKELFPERKGYVDVYNHYGQLGPRSILGHGVHLTEDEYQVLHDTGTAISHCPTSNLFLGSGLFDLEKAMDPRRPIRVGLGTDLGAGTNFSQLATMNEAYKVAQLNGYSLSAPHAYYLATRGAANALYLDDKIGSLEVGKEADIAILDLKSTPIVEYRMKYAKNLEEILFVLMTLGDDRTVKATYVAGEILYSRDPHIENEKFAPSLNIT